MNSNFRINSKKNQGIIFLGLIAAWFIYIFYKNQTLLNSYKITTGQVKHIFPPSYKNNGYKIQYDYLIDDKKYRGELGIAECNNYNTTNLSLLLVNRRFPVVYDVKDNENSRIIMTESLCYKFKIALSDTILYADSIISCQQVYSNY
ncbi:MAG: hypothetical protein H7068_12240 [Pedobacter sp.]|nr:hypothetical protein [Chitinophagaceae bacterium]